MRYAVLGALALRGERRRREQVDDLVQEVWCRLLAGDRRALLRYRGDTDASALCYVRRVATTVVLDALRLHWTRKRRLLGVISLDETDPALTAGWDRSGCPERRLMARERLGQLLALCRELLGPRPGRERLTIARLGLLEGRRSREIAAELGGRWTVRGIDSLLFRLRRGLERHGVRPPRRPSGRSAV